MNHYRQANRLVTDAKTTWQILVDEGKCLASKTNGKPLLFLRKTKPPTAKALRRILENIVMAHRRGTILLKSPDAIHSLTVANTLFS